MLNLNKLLSLASRIQKRSVFELRTLRQPIVEIEGIKIFTDKKLSVWMRQVLSGTTLDGKKEMFFTYEQEELQILKNQLSQTEIVMEIGAGIGFISTYCAKLIGSERVFTYEANPGMERYIRNTYKLNHVSPTLEMCMIGEQNGEKVFYVEDDFWDSSTIPKSPSAKTISVTVKSFNQEVKRLNPSFLIIDIEGGEYELSKYAEFNNVQKIMIETHEEVIGRDKNNLLISRFIQAGFELNKIFCIGNVLFFQKRQK